MKCPQCHSDDVKRSRRKFPERIALFVLRGQVFRCRDCKKRFWVGVQWSKVILAFLTITVTASIVVAVVITHEIRVAEAAAARKVVRKYRIRPRPMPRGLPPLSKVPRPEDDPTPAAKK